MNYFTLFAHGEDFDVDSFLEETSLSFDNVWRRGDLRGCAEFIQDKHPTSGVEIQLGNGWELPYYQQDQIAANFLKTNQDALKLLADFPGVSTCLLRLQFRIELTPGTCGFGMSASSMLMLCALLAGFEINCYADLVRKDSDAYDE